MLFILKHSPFEGNTFALLIATQNSNYGVERLKTLLWVSLGGVINDGCTYDYCVVCDR